MLKFQRVRNVMKRLVSLNKNQEKVLNNIILDRESLPQEVRRAQAILMLSEKANKDLIKRITHLSKSRMYEVYKLFILHGEKGIRNKKRKRAKEILTKNQINEVIDCLKTKTPEDFGFDQKGWSTPILAQIIKEKYGAQYKSKTSLYLIFRKASFSYHKPGQVYKNRNDEDVKKWREETTPIIEKAYRDKNTVVIVEDEMILTSTTTFQKIWLPIGNFPKHEVTTSRKRRCLYGFLETKTGFEYAYKTERCASDETCYVLKKIMKKHKGYKVLLCWDNAPWHKSKKVRALIESYGDRLQIIEFPKYAPEQNPQEHVWKAAREKITHNRFISNIDKITNKVVEFLNDSIFEYKFLGLSPVI